MSKIVSWDISRISVPLITPFITSVRRCDATDGAALKLYTDDGVCGYGEASATMRVAGEDFDSIVSALDKYILPAIKGKDVFDKNAAANAIRSSCVKNTSAKAAAEIAYYDLYARMLGMPLYRLLGRSDAGDVCTDITVSLDDPEKMVSDSVSALKAGFTSLKIKLGRSPREDAERVFRIREAVGENVTLRADANQGWTVKEAVKIIRELEKGGAGLELVEQPCDFLDIDGLERITGSVETPILADECVYSPRDCTEIIKRHAADMINIKLMKTGGITDAVTIIEICRCCGVKVMMGSMLENPISITAAAHIAHANPDVVTAIDLDAPFLCKNDGSFDRFYRSGTVFASGKIALSDEAGIGILLK